jgi:hypothetical protein
MTASVEPVRIEPVAIFRDYHSLLATIRAERERQGLSNEALDDLAGLPDRLAQKIQAWPAAYARGMGAISQPLVMQALGLAIMVVRVPKRADLPAIEEQQFDVAPDATVEMRRQS